MNRHFLKSITLVLAMAPTQTAMAQSVGSDGFVHVGAGRFDFADKGEIFLNGTLDPNAGYRTPRKWGAVVEGGYFVLRPVAVRLSASTPVSTSNVPAGSLEGLPNLGTDTFSVFTLTATYHPLRGRVISPYLGGGVAQQHVWRVKDELATNLRIGDSFGPVIQGGVEVNVTPRLGLFADGKKAFYEADASGDIGPTRVTARARLDPVILSAGAVFRF